MISFLKEERKSLGLNQSYVAEKAGISVQSLINYEKGKRQPDLSVLVKMAKIGYDIQFVVTGNRDTQHLNAEEAFLIDKFRAADKSKRNTVLGLLIMDEQNMLRAVAGEIGHGKGSQVGGNHVSVEADNSGNVAGGDISIEK